MIYRFQSKANRDQKAAELKAQGHSVRKGSSRNQVLSPDYVQDYDGPRAPNGFGGSAPEFFAAIYKVEVI
jgi:hypothetical protein